MTELLHVVVGRQRRVTVYSDDHRAYPRAIRAVCPEAIHLVTPSSAKRTNRNPLWEVNLCDLLIRHCGANHKRETIAWSKRRQASAERLSVFLVWRNYIKGRREKIRGSPTPAMERGMQQRALTVGEILEQRLFPSHVELQGRWGEYYAKTVETRCLGRQRRHELRYAA